MSEIDDIREQLRLAMSVKKYSVRQVSELSGYSKSTINSFINGYTSIKLQTLIDISQSVGCKVGLKWDK